MGRRCGREGLARVHGKICAGRRPARHQLRQRLYSAMVLEAVLKACGDDLSTENILKQAYAVKDMELPMLLPGIKVNTSPTDHVPVDQMQFMRFNGKTWDRFGDLQTGN